MRDVAEITYVQSSAETDGKRNATGHLSGGLSDARFFCWPPLWILGPVVVETYTAENILVIQQTEFSVLWNFVTK